MVDVDDPDDALSFSGVMFMPAQIAERVEGLLDRPEPVLAIPRWRGFAGSTHASSIAAKQKRSSAAGQRPSQVG